MVLGSTGKDSIWKHCVSPLSGLNNYWNWGRANQVERNTGIKGNKENKYPKGRVIGHKISSFSMETDPKLNTRVMLDE